MAEPNVERELMGAEEGACEVRLWQAVVVRTIQDWMSDHSGKSARPRVICLTAIPTLPGYANPRD